METSDYKKDLSVLAKGGGLSTIGDFFNQFSHMVTGVLVTRLFNNPATFGLYSLALRLVTLLQILAMPGTYQGVKRFLPIYRAQKNPAAVKGLLVFVLIITGILSIIVMTTLTIFSPFIANLFNKAGAEYYISVLALSIPFFTYLSIMVSCLVAINRVKYQVLIEKIFLPGFRMLVLLSFLFISTQVIRNIAVAWSFPITNAFGALIAAYFFLKSFKILRNPAIRPEYHGWELMKFSLPVAATRPLAFLMIYVGTFVISFFLTENDVGRYDAVIRITLIIIVPLQSGIIVFSPLISRLHHLGALSDLRRHYIFISKWILAISLFIFMCFFLFSKPLFNIFGKGYNDPETRATLMLIGLAQLFNAGVGPVGMMIAMTGKPRINLYNNMILLALNTVMMIIFVPLLGIVGAGVAQSIAIIGINTLFLLQVWHYMKVHPFNLSYFKPLLSGVFSAGIVFAIITASGIGEMWENMHPDDITAYLWAVVMGGLLAILFTAGIWALGIEESDRFVLRKMIFKFKSMTYRNNGNSDNEK